MPHIILPQQTQSISKIVLTKGINSMIASTLISIENSRKNMYFFFKHESMESCSFQGAIGVRCKCER